MGKDDRQIALRDTQEDEQQEQRYTGDDVGVDHRDVVQEGHHATLAAVQVIDADGGDRSQDRSHDRGGKGDQQRILDGRQKSGGILHAAVEEILVELRREARPVAQTLGLGKRENHDEDDRRIEDDQQEPDIDFGQDFLRFHQMSPPLVSSACSPPCSTVVKPMISSMMSESAAP